MNEFKRETTNTQEDSVNPEQNSTKSVASTSVKEETSSILKVQYFVYYVFGILEILLAFRFVLKLAGASQSSGFVDFIYHLSRIFVLPFAGIFHVSLTQGAETTGVFEWSTIVAIVVYVLVAWGIVKLIRISSGEKQQTD